MPLEDIPNSGSQPPTDDANRKLWFEYLAKLNDRELQSARATGFTPWALVAVAAAIVYSAVPKIPSFLATARAASTSLAILLLELDAIFFVGASLLLLITYCAPAPQSRLSTQHNRRSSALALFASRFGTAVALLAHFVEFANLSGFTFVRWVLLIFGLFWLLNLVESVWDELKTAREAKKHGLPLVNFTVTSAVSLMSSPIGAGVMFVIGAVPLITLILFLRALHYAGVPWVITLGAATDVVVLVAVLATLFFMGVASVSRGVFLALECDVDLKTFLLRKSRLDLSEKPSVPRSEIG